jgi:hypothetical protein
MTEKNIIFKYKLITNFVYKVTPVLVYKQLFKGHNRFWQNTQLASAIGDVIQNGESVCDVK